MVKGIDAEVEPLRLGGVGVDLGQGQIVEPDGRLEVGAQGLQPGAVALINVDDRLGIGVAQAPLHHG